MTRVFANGRTIVHKGDGLVDIAGPPDVCNTPSPGGPVPVPYVNAARSSDLAHGARHTVIAGSPIALASSYIATSSGDEPGTAGGGLISRRIRGKMKWQSTSLDVRVEGNGVARFSDAVSHNGNTFNTSFFQRGSGWAYGDDFKEPCPICTRGPADHRVRETDESHRLARQLYDALEAAYQRYQQLSDQRRALEPEVNRLRQQKADLDAAGPSTARPSKDDKKQRRELDKQLRAASSEMKQYEAQIGKIAVHKKLTAHGGYMIGVMVCKSNKIFAAMSGQTLRGFKQVVEELGWELCDRQATADDFIAANPSISDLDKRSALHESWDAVQTRQDERAPYYNVPGACAAAKLLTQSGGHIARGMTEMFFAPREPHQVTLRYQHLDRYHPLRVALHKITCGQFGRSDPEREQAFDPGLTVPSCASCQALIPMVLCDVKRRTCP